MGVFANELPGNAPRWIENPSLRRPWSGESGYEALGVQVPTFRKTALYHDLKAQGWGERRGEVGGTEWCVGLVDRMARHVEKDEPHEAMEEAFTLGMDVTSVYRALAVLLTATKPREVV